MAPGNMISKWFCGKNIKDLAFSAGHPNEGCIPEDFA